MKRPLKNLVATTAVATWRAGLHRLAHPRIKILLYHRVSDETQDNLTIGIAQFDRQMALLRKYCQPIPLEHILNFKDIPRSYAPLVAVTFDDGYLTNYTNAAPILMRHGIPAAFFVSTGMIGTDRQFPHDRRRGAPPRSLMRWEHLREMHQAGFTIGSHAVNHIDCAAEPEKTVRAELSQSLADLRCRLGLRDVLFAYPYGGRCNMTPQRLELVKQTGYSGCLSAYGGANTIPIDRFNLLRQGIHWEFSDAVFLFYCLGLKG